MRCECNPGLLSKELTLPTAIRLPYRKNATLQTQPQTTGLKIQREAQIKAT